MRISFSYAGGRGHAEPLRPIARAARAAGHDVAFAEQPPTPGGGDGPSRPTPLLPLDPEREDRDLREHFARRLAGERARWLLDQYADDRPDVVVCDETDFGAMVAAERLGVAYASLVVIAAGSFVRRDLVDEPLHALRAVHGLPPDPELVMLERHLVLSPVPPSFRDPTVPAPATTRWFRAQDVGPPVPHDLPCVYVTLGTVFNLESGDLMARLLAGLAELPIRVIATVGHEIDPADLGSLPEQVRVERFVPQAEVLPGCDLVVCHGGSGSVLGALAHGLPMVVVPMGADQPHNAARCEALGVAQVLDPIAATPAMVGKAVTEVLADESYRRAAQVLAAETAALPDPAEAVAELERIAQLT